MRNPPSGLMVFAAGFGTRMKPLTLDTPKPLLRVGGTTLLDHTLALADQANLAPQVVNAHYHGNQIVDHLTHCDVQVVPEDPILDTGGGLKNAAPFFEHSHVITSNSDAVWAGPNPFETLLQDWDDGCDAMLLCVPLQNALGRIPPGDFDVTEHGTLKRGGALVYTGIQIIRLKLVEKHPETVFSFNTIWTELIAQNRLQYATYPGTWCDVGRPENIATATRLLADV